MAMAPTKESLLSSCPRPLSLVPGCLVSLYVVFSGCITKGLAAVTQGALRGHVLPAAPPGGQGGGGGHAAHALSSCVIMVPVMYMSFISTWDREESTSTD